MTTYLAAIEIEPQPDGSLRPVVTDGEVNLEEYSLFKYGGGNAASYFGSQLAKKMAPTLATLKDELVYVSASPYKTAPPASNALVAPFIKTAAQIAEATGQKRTFQALKILRAHPSDGDYSKMTVEQRAEAMNNNDLSVEMRLADRQVIVLDDIYVTGLHEVSIRKLLKREQSAATLYGYICRVSNGAQYPESEAIINASSVRTIADLGPLALNDSYIPNARVCKFILSSSIDEIKGIGGVLPPHILEVMSEYIEGDGIDKMAMFAGKYEVFKQAIGSSGAGKRPSPQPSTIKSFKS